MTEKSLDQKTVDFEASLAELNTIVERMEQSTLTLQESMDYFKRGMQLTQSCQQALQEAEQTIRTLSVPIPSTLLKENGQ